MRSYDYKVLFFIFPMMFYVFQFYISADATAAAAERAQVA